MPELDPDEDFIWAYDRATGLKLPHKVPKHYPHIFPNVTATPVQKAKTAARRQAEPNPAPEAHPTED